MSAFGVDGRRSDSFGFPNGDKSRFVPTHFCAGVLGVPRQEAKPLGSMRRLDTGLGPEPLGVCGGVGLKGVDLELGVGAVHSGGRIAEGRGR
eukprot:scaffold97633_cov50-Prasinocladus_malaysianus.AAC.3